MAIQIIGNNINVYGDEGRFETDPSTWGFTSLLDLTRSSSQKFEGTYSLKGVSNLVGDFTADISSLVVGKAHLYVGKFYLAKIRVKTLSGKPITTDSLDVLKFRFGSMFSQTAPLLEDENLGATLQSTIDNWVEIVFKFRLNPDSPGLGLPPRTDEEVSFSLGITPASGPLGTWASNGELYADKFEIYEYEEVADVCTLAIDIPNSIITDDSGANDGAIQVEVTGQTDPEYSIDGGAWQSSNQFAGLGPGIYMVSVREKGDLTCLVTQAFSINSSNLTFSFTTLVVDETVSGSNNGSIEIIVSGTGGPFTYSIDGGQNYNGGNVFTDLGPGSYTVVVQDTANNRSSAIVLVGMGQVVFEKAFFSKNHIPFSVPAGANSEEENYKRQIDVRLQEGDGNFTNSIFKAAKEPINGICQFNLRPAFRGIFEMTPPRLDLTAFEPVQGSTATYKVFFGDTYDLLEQPLSYEESNPFLVVLGGIDKLRANKIDYLGQYLPDNKKFLTWSPFEKTVDLNQTEFLNFFVSDRAIAQLNFNVTAYFDDGTSQTSVLSNQTVVYGEIHVLQVGPTFAGIVNVDPSKTLKSYKVWLTDQISNVISEEKSFVLTKFKRSRTRYYLFVNALGVFEVLRTVGHPSSESRIKKGLFQKYLPSDYNPLDGEFESGLATKSVVTKNSTGHFSGAYAKKWQSWMHQLALSPKVFDITDGQHIPVTIKMDKVVSDPGKSKIYFQRFDAIHAYTDENFTPEVL